MRIERADLRLVFPSVEVFPQFRCTHNAERTYAHILLNTSFRSSPLRLFSLSLSLSHSFLIPHLCFPFVGTSICMYIRATSNEIISLPVPVRKFRGIMLCRGRHVLPCMCEIESALKDQTERAPCKSSWTKINFPNANFLHLRKLL